MVMVAVRGGCVCVCGWVVGGGGCDVIFNITEGVRTIFFGFGGGGGTV